VEISTSGELEIRSETSEVLSVWGELSIQAIGVQQQVASSDFRSPGQFPSDEGEATRDSGELLGIRRELRRVEIAGGEIKNDGPRAWLRGQQFRRRPAIKDTFRWD